MSGNSTYLGGAIENWIKGTTMPTAPSATYVALFNGDPTDAGTGGSEVTTTIRTAGRVQATFGAIANKVMSNSAVVNFGPSAAQTQMSHFALYDAASNGNMLMSGPLGNGSSTVTTGTTVSFPIGTLVVNQ